MTDYRRDMYKQLTEQTEKAERLERENVILRKEVKELTSRIDRITANIEAKIEAAVAKATEPLHTAVVEKECQIKKANDEIERLKSVINKNSGNSSKPPRSDGFKKPVTNSREPSGKKPGGQPGRVGRYLQKPENWEELESKGVAITEIVDHTNGHELYEIRCVLDIDIKAKWTEHRYPLGAKELREQAQPVVYGEKIKALAIVLSQEEYVAQGRVCELIGFLTGGGIRYSQGCLNKTIQAFSGRLDGEIEKIRTDLLNGQVMHTDETTARTTQWAEYDQEDEAEKLERSVDNSVLAYIRTHSNAHSTLLTVNRRKNMDGVERDGILGKYHGILSHDHESKFYNYGAEHATCGTHLQRDLKGISDGYGCIWPMQMRGFLGEMNDYKKADIAREEDLPSGCGQEQYEEFSQRYVELLLLGNKELTKTENIYAKDELRKMLDRLRDYKDAYLLFIKKYVAPFTNNLAERDLRPGKTKQAVSGCFRSWAGLLAYARIRSFISTVRKRDLDVMQTVSNLLRGVSALS